MDNELCPKDFNTHCHFGVKLLAAPFRRECQKDAWMVTAVALELAAGIVAAAPFLGPVLKFYLALLAAFANPAVFVFRLKPGY